MLEQNPDILNWGNYEACPYTVKAGYKHLSDQTEIIESWPWELIWKTKLPTKVICFTWTTLKGACLTQ